MHVFFKKGLVKKHPFPQQLILTLILSLAGKKDLYRVALSVGVLIS